MNDIKCVYNEISPNMCELSFISEVQGIATTYANLYRRALLQGTPILSVAGIKCTSNGHVYRNLFEIVPGVSNSLIDINTMLHTAVFDIDTDCDDIVLTINIAGTVKLSDICNKYVVSYGDIGDGGINLVSEDKVLTTVVDDRSLTLDIYLKKGVGFSPKDINTQSFIDALGNSNINDWIISDSKHSGIVSVSYHDEVVLGKQTVVLGITSYKNQIRTIVQECRDRVVSQLNGLEI